MSGIDVGRASPPHRERSVAEFHVAHDGMIDIPAEIYRERGVLRISIYGKSGGESWNFPVADFLAAIGKGVAILDEYYESVRSAGKLESTD